MSRRFTVAQANALLPQLVPTVEQLMGAWQRLRAARPDVEQLMAEHVHGDPGGELLSQVALDTITVQDAVDAIQAQGVVVRDPAAGLLDFPAERDGERIYLCWCYPESRVAYWHSVHGGYGGRHPLGSG
jgi:hypothetical protein